MSGTMHPELQRERDEQIRRYAAEGQPTAWIAERYGLSTAQTNRVIAKGGTLEPRLVEAQPLAAWERSLRTSGIPIPTKRAWVPKPPREWVESLEDIEPTYHADAHAAACVYFIHDDAYVKIGLSTQATVHSRFAGLQTSNPRQLTLARMVAGDVGSEARLHSYFAHLHVRGEWFTIDTELNEIGRLGKHPDHLAQ
jgi:hypothetical protein